LVGGAALVLACHAGPSTAPSTSPREPAAVDHRPARPYWGTWIGPQLRLSFAGPWVLIVPHDAGPQAQPIELRVSVERQEGGAFALRTSVAQRYAADFVRPSDWTLLVEHGALAIAMGDEPLTAYVASDERLLVGPELLETLAIPPDIAGEALLECLEFASLACRELEAEGPRAAGCREAQWGVCVAHRGGDQADPTLRAASLTARAIAAHDLALRFAEGLLAAAREGPELAAAQALHRRALERAATLIGQLKRDGPLPSSDPSLDDLLAALRDAGLDH